MANPSIWAPGTAVNADSTIRTQSFNSAPGQTQYTLTEFTYYLNTGSLFVFVGGSLQRVGIDWTETATNSFTLTEAPPEGTVVYAVGFIELQSGYTDAEQAAIYAAQAAASALEAAGYATDSQTEANNSLSSAQLAEDWANKTDAPVDGIEYSAKYYALEAELEANNSAASAAQAASYASVGFDVASAIYDFGYITDPSLTFTTDYGSIA